MYRYFMNQYTVHKLMYIHVLYYKYILISILKTMHRRSMVIILNLMILHFLYIYNFILIVNGLFVCVFITLCLYIYQVQINIYVIIIIYYL